MALVDYASSDEDPDPQPQPQQPRPQSSTSSSSQPHQTQLSSGQLSQDMSPSLPPPFEKLPDASLLLNSPTLSQPVGTGHSARVAAAVSQNASRKREANGSSSSSIRGKIPKGNLPHSKNIPDTSSGNLIPPQLRGRSNIVTEDISKLFVKRNSKDKP